MSDVPVDRGGDALRRLQVRITELERRLEALQSGDEREPLTPEQVKDIRDRMLDRAWPFPWHWTCTACSVPRVCICHSCDMCVKLNADEISAMERWIELSRETHGPRR